MECRNQIILYNNESLYKIRSVLPVYKKFFNFKGGEIHEKLP